jgi:hypothetical protein
MTAGTSTKRIKTNWPVIRLGGSTVTWQDHYW